MAKAKLFHVHCTLPNASDNISGIAFIAVDDHVRTADPVTAEVADIFRSIPGYQVVADGAKAPSEAPPAPAAPPAPTAADASNANDQSGNTPSNDPAKLL